MVDDGSTLEENNRYHEILANYCNVKLLTKENGGAASARNFGVRQATGELIAFLDSDDIWLDGKINSQLEIINQNEDIGLVLGNIIVADEALAAKYKSAKKIPGHKKEIINGFFKGEIVMNTPTILVKKDIFDTIGGFPEDLKYREDHFFLMSIANICKIRCDEKYLTVRRERKGSLSNVEDIDTEIAKHCPFWAKSKHAFPFVDVTEAKGKLLTKLYIYYLRNNRHEDILRTQAIALMFDKRYWLLFLISSKLSWLIKMLYNYRIKFKNANL